MKITQSIALDFGRDTTPITVFAKQNDSQSRFIEIMPLNRGKNYELENGITARLHLTKPDGNTVINDATISDDGVITVELTQQTLAAAGIAVAEIGLYRGETLLSSQMFYVNVGAAAYKSGAPESSGEYQSFTEALGRVDEVLSMAEQVDISATQTATGADITVTNREGVKTTVHIDTLFAVESWNDIRNVVRLGVAEKLFPVGYEFTTYDSDENTFIIWVVRAHDHHTAADVHLEHTMTLEMKYVYSTSGTYKPIQYSARGALYYAENGLAAGTYHFTVANQTWYPADNGKTYQFTLSEPVPAGGQIVLDATYSAALAGKSVKTYANPSSIDVIETATITDGNGGTNLGTTDGTGGMNHMHRALLGSNNYAQSAVDQWLNSSEAAGSVWTPQTVFDRPPTWANTLNGFMHGLPEDFLAAVQPAVIPCRTNSVYEVDSLDGTEFTPNQTYELTRKFFLLSRPEVFGTWDNADIKDGEVLEYYDGLTATERIHRGVGGMAYRSWLRSSVPHLTNHARVVYTDGTVYNSGAGNAHGVVVACIIA